MRSGFDEENIEPDFRYIGPKEIRDLEKLCADDLKTKDKRIINSREFMKSYYKTGPLKKRDPRHKEFNVNMIIQKAADK